MPILDPGEEILAGEHTKFYNTQGYLTLTSRRLIFEYKPRGHGKKTYTSINMVLEGIADAFVEGDLRKKLVIIPKPGSFGKDVVSRLEFSVRDPHSWQNRLVCPKCATLNALDLPKCSRCALPKPR